jgi:hypothetical protein
MTNPTDLNPSGQVSPPKKGATGGEASPITRLRTWLHDSYNGLYKIVLEPSMPSRGQVSLVILGAIIGLIWAWGLFPAVFTGGNPDRLNQAAQDQWIRMVAIAASVGKYSPENATDLASRVTDPIGTIDRLAAEPGEDTTALQSLRGMLPGDMTGTPRPDAGGLFASIWQILLLIVLIVIIVPICVLLWRLLIQPNIWAPMLDSIKAMTNKEYAEQKKREAEARRVAREQKQAKQSMVVEADVNLGAPVMKTLSIFSPTREYDDSFEIELPLDQGGDFLGQCGATIAEAVAPDPVAIEMWLFDMFTQEDKKRVFITEAGYNDPSIRGRIEASLGNPADIVVARDGAKLIVDSEKLRLQGEMKSLQVDEKGRFAGFQMPIAAWRKDGVNVGVSVPTGGNVGFAPPPPSPTGLPPSLSTYDDLQFDPPPSAPTPLGGRSLSDYDEIQFDSPPMMPGQQPLQPPPLQPPTGLQPPPPSTGMQPLQPPPLRGNPPPPEDDPFGGTGDFTPLGKN